MSSPPSTPPNVAPSTGDSSNWRFVSTGTACEWGESYHPGGYHPVHLGDVFRSRYRTIRKLGYGSFSTVWLAVDQLLFRYVALKINIAKSSTLEELPVESRLYDELSSVGNHWAASSRIASLLDSFSHHGPNGTHQCFVFEVMGPNVSQMLRLSPLCQIGQHWERCLPLLWTRRILRDVLLGLETLHSLGIVHGDLNPGNILFTIPNLSLKSNPPEGLCQQPGEGDILKRKDGKADPWGPTYLLRPNPLHEYASIDQDPLVKISDLGGAFPEASPPSKLVTPRALRAPEMILGDQSAVGTGVDIWCFGCLMFEFLTGRALFWVEPLDGSSDDECPNDEHWIQITEAIKPLPMHLLARWGRRERYYGPNGERVENEESEDEDGVLLADVGAVKSLEDRLSSLGMDEEGKQEMLRLMRMALEPDSQKRASASELVQQKWFQDGHLK